MRRHQLPQGPFHALQNEAPQSSAGTKYSHPPTKEDWSSVQMLIHHLYVVKKQPLSIIEDELRARGFRATPRMIKQRCKSWGYQKNAKRDDWEFLAILDARRKDAGKVATVFEIHGQRRTVKDLHRFIRNQQSTPENFLANAHLKQDGKSCPAYIRALTPGPEPGLEDLKDSLTPAIGSSSSACPTSPLSSSSTFGTLYLDSVNAKYHDLRHIETDNPTTIGTKTVVTTSRPLTYDTSCNYQRVIQTTHTTRCQCLSEPLLQMGALMIHQHPKPEDIQKVDLRTWQLFYGSRANSHLLDGSSVSETGPDYICERCHRPSQHHFVAPENVTLDKTFRGSLLTDSQTQNEHFHLPVSQPGKGSWVWMSRCFLACIYFSRGDEYWGEKALNDAAYQFEKALGVPKDSRNPNTEKPEDNLILTAAQMTITMLHHHDQDVITRKIIRAMRDVVQRTRQPSDAIRITIEYYDSAADAFHTDEFPSEKLRDVYEYFKNEKGYGPKHPHTITAQHNYGFLLRNYDELADAEHHLGQAHAASLEYFGRWHMQTVMSLAGLAGCLRTTPRRRVECIELHRAVIVDAIKILDDLHPYVLRLKWELAIQLERRDNDQDQNENRDEILALWKEVVWGRVKMLGHTHDQSCYAREHYEERLKSYGLWTIGADESPSSERLELFNLFDRNDWEAEDRDTMMADRAPSPTSSNDLAAY